MILAHVLPPKWAHAAAWACLVALAPSAAFAATWRNNRTRPHLGHVIAIDATGEGAWPYGQEDVAGDGLATFGAPEQGIDVRTAYAATDSQRFWVRVYLSGTSAPDAKLTVFVFVDADKNPQTGGSAASVDISPAFTVDPTVSGYEHVIGIRGSGEISDVWEWRAQQAKFVSLGLNRQRLAAEAGKDADPIALNRIDRAYVQATVPLSDINLSSVCSANLYIRSTSETPGLGLGDLDVGRANECIPSDRDGDKVPDVLLPATCTTDAQCPGGGSCTNGKCVVARPCSLDTECASGQQCSADGACFAAAGGPCTVSAECGGLVCEGQKCVSCASAGCAAGSQCGADGKCTPVSGPGGGGAGGAGADGGIALRPGENLEGGAFNCAMSTPRAATCALGGSAFFGIGLLLARRRRSRSGGGHEQ